MLCPRCYGKHVVLVSGAVVPCPECAGIGELHCCDGLREQDECRYAPPPVRALANFAPESATSPDTKSSAPLVLG